MDTKSHYNLLISELFASLNLSSPAESDLHSFSIDEDGSSLHIKFQPITETIVLSRMVTDSVELIEQDHYKALLGLNGFSDDLVKKGVFVDQSNNVQFWIQSPVHTLDLAQMQQLIDDLMVEDTLDNVEEDGVLGNTSTFQS